MPVRTHRLATLGASGALVAGLAVWAALTNPFTNSADALSALGIAVVWLEAVFARRPAAGTGPALAATDSSWWPWLAFVVVVVSWELVSFFLGPRVQHPTLSSLYDSATQWRAVKGVAFALWLALGATLARR